MCVVHISKSNFKFYQIRKYLRQSKIHFISNNFTSTNSEHSKIAIGNQKSLCRICKVLKIFIFTVVHKSIPFVTKDIKSTKRNSSRFCKNVPRSSIAAQCQIVTFMFPNKFALFSNQSASMHRIYVAGYSEDVRNLILVYPTLICKFFRTFLGEIHRVNPEILVYPRIHRIHL